MTDDLGQLRRAARLTRRDAYELCGVSAATWRRWENGHTRTPLTVIRLLQTISGDLSAFGWSGWRINHGELYAPEMPAYRRGLGPGDVRAGWWLTWMSSSRKYRTAKVMTADAANSDALRSNIQRLERRNGAKAVSQARGEVGRCVDDEGAD
ncbi:MAG: helix-turn-helix domain-containing protein [Acidihalobacter sp.]|uniref:helix-turn-helix domain-containing protein n=1 Tax=Acidihalobacter sp. TaxID=1872108 RepID=UPI00307F68B5